MTETNSMDSEMAHYWNENGGRRWVANIERVERMLQPLAASLLTEAAAGVGERVMDVGCGGGLTSKAFADAVGDTGAVLGLDISEVILEVAKRRFETVPNLRFERNDAGSMFIEPASLDLVTSRFGVMFFPDPLGAFANLHGALRPTGRLSFICWQALKLNPWMAVPVRAAFEILPRPAPLAPNAPGPFAFADPDHVCGTLERAGFQRVTLTPHEALLDLGSLEDAIEQMTHMGPAAQAFDEASTTDKTRVLEALTVALTPYVSAGTVRMLSATWLVSARPT